MLVKLYEISAALERAIEGGYTVDPDTGEVLWSPDDIEELAELRENKLEACGLMVKSFDAEAQAIYDEEKALKKRRAVIERKADRLRDYVLADMLADGTVVNTPRIHMKPARTPARVEVDDERAIPDKFMRVKREPDKASIGAAIKEGNEVPGAHISERGWRLAIK